MTDPVLDVRNLQKSFGALTATNDVSLDLRPGEIHALIGPNGAGKSTLIAQIAGTLAPDRGAIHLSGQDVTTLSAAARSRKGLGRSFQISSLAMPLSAFDNISVAALGARNAKLSFWRQIRRDSQLSDTVKGVLERIGLSTRAHLPVAHLSHGERRLVELGCVLAGQPKAILLDEPMAGLGQDGTHAMTGFLANLKSTAPILLVEHDMDAVFALADRLSVLVDGRIIAQGPPDVIRADREVEAAYLGELPC